MLSQHLGAPMEFLNRAAPPKRFLQIGYALGDGDLNCLHVLPEEEDWIDTVLSAGGDRRMEHRDPRNPGPVPSTHRRPDFGIRQLRRQHSLNVGRADLQGLEGWV